MNPPLFFAGSFNPIHHGHLIIAQCAAEAVGADRVVILPSAQNPLKKGDTASCEDRLNMCRLAVASLPGFDVSELELRRPGPQLYYRHRPGTLKLQNYAEIFWWLLGADQIAEICHRSGGKIDQDLLAEIRFVIADRPGFEVDWGKLPAGFAMLKEPRSVQGAPIAAD